MSKEATEECFTGIGVSPGIAIAEVVFKHDSIFEPEVYAIEASQVAREGDRLQAALVKTRQEILQIKEQIEAAVGSEDASIFDAHLLVLEDHAVLDKVFKKVEAERINIESALYQVLSHYMEGLRRVEDPYLRERAIDLKDVLRRILKNFGEDGHGDSEDLGGSEERPIALLARDLTPSDTAGLNRGFVTGFVTEAGSQTSHTAIMARSLGIPAVVGVSGLEARIHQGDPVLIDGYHGLVYLRPSEETLARYRTMALEKSEIEQGLELLADAEIATRDGFRPVLSCNIEFASEMERVRRIGGHGVGLYRTEFRYMNGRRLPTEEELTADYSQVVDEAAPFPVIIRTLDVGGDKLPSVGSWMMAPEPNPFLGWRGIRLSLGEPELFRTQLRAILRAGSGREAGKGEVAVMFPLVCCIGEVREAKRHLAEVKAELEAEGVPCPAKVQTGVMIEVPSAALTADLIAPEVDFFSIGTNDLVQYTIAVDRTNQRVANLYAPRHPAILRLIRHVVDAAEAHGRWVGVCGEMAADLLCTPLLLGLGVTELSVGPGQLLALKRAVGQLDRSECVAFVREMEKLDSAEAITAQCREMARRNYPELLEYLE